jgi:AcrR family transcriptional regulator
MLGVMPRRHRGARAGTRESRAEILKAAIEILRTEDDTALTTRRVAYVAGCSTIGVYHWFGSKDGLVNALLVEGYEAFSEALKKARPKPGPLGGLVAMGQAYRKWALENPVYYRVMFLHAIQGHVHSVDAAAAGLTSFEILRNEVEREQKLGRIKQEKTDEVALTLWGLVHGLVSLEVTQVEPPSLAGKKSLHTRAYNMALELFVEGFASTAIPSVKPTQKAVTKSTAKPPKPVHSSVS